MADNGNNPNVNIFLIEEVENLTSRAMGVLLQVNPENHDQQKQLKKCTNALDEWQTTRLFELRKAFE